MQWGDSRAGQLSRQRARPTHCYHFCYFFVTGALTRCIDATKIVACPALGDGCDAMSKNCRNLTRAEKMSRPAVFPLTFLTVGKDDI